MEPTLRRVFREWWRVNAARDGRSNAARRLAREIWDYLRDSTPERRRQRYGDMDYDWAYRVNTTSGTVGWRDRLMGVFLSAYQPTDPAHFQEMMANLPIDFRGFTFVDLGSGKGRTLLMASEYPFRRIVGVEILPELHRAAEQNIRDYKSPTQRCKQIESICEDARDFELPAEPLLLYLFNPVPEEGLRQMLLNLERSLRQHPRTVYVLYCNPLLGHVLEGSTALKGMGGAQHYSVYANVE